MAEFGRTAAAHGGEEQVPPGQAMSMGQHMLDKGAQMLQSLTPIKQMIQHACTFALYSHDMSRQIETHHYVSRLNQDFLQCAVYDSDDSTARLIGVEYIISDRLFESLPLDEQKLWHSHAYEVFFCSISRLRWHVSWILIIYKYIIIVIDKIGALGESAGTRDGRQTGARKSSQDLRQVLVHVADW